MKNTKVSFVVHGIIIVAVHLPMLIVTSFWGLSIIAIFNLDSVTEPFWELVTMFPLLISPASCIVGIIRGSINFKKHKSARLCLILSIIGILIYIGMIVLCGIIEEACRFASEQLQEENSTIPIPLTRSVFECAFEKMPPSISKSEIKMYDEFRPTGARVNGSSLICKALHKFDIFA